MIIYYVEQREMKSKEYLEEDIDETLGRELDHMYEYWSDDKEDVEQFIETS